ncbi:MAG: 50S ribosomal protein L6 [Acidobacteria bacterium]|nr:50S ribosomal protein L6 [Acidobacteriota bacterium]
MSRIGNAPITIPSAAKVELGADVIKVKGPKGELTAPIPAGVEAKVEDGQLVLTRKGVEYAAKHGLARALAQNAVTGATTGFTKQLEIVGVGYRASVAGKVAVFNLGYSHPIEVLMPEDVDIKIEQNTKIEITGPDRQVVGQIAAMIRSLRPPDPYKQKGVRYAGEELRKKEGKTGSK